MVGTTSGSHPIAVLDISDSEPYRSQFVSNRCLFNIDMFFCSNGVVLGGMFIYTLQTCTLHFWTGFVIICVADVKYNSASGNVLYKNIVFIIRQLCTVRYSLAFNNLRVYAKGHSTAACYQRGVSSLIHIFGGTDRTFTSHWSRIPH